MATIVRCVELVASLSGGRRSELVFLCPRLNGILELTLITYIRQHIGLPACPHCYLSSLTANNNKNGATHKHKGHWAQKIDQALTSAPPSLLFFRLVHHALHAAKFVT